jgi:hypothetical protein
LKPAILKNFLDILEHWLRHPSRLHLLPLPKTGSKALPVLAKLGLSTLLESPLCHANPQPPNSPNPTGKPHSELLGQQAKAVWPHSQPTAEKTRREAHDSAGKAEHKSTPQPLGLNPVIASGIADRQRTAFTLALAPMNPSRRVDDNRSIMRGLLSIDAILWALLVFALLLTMLLAWWLS